MSKKSISKLHQFIQDEKPNEKELAAFVRDLANHNDPTERTITVRYSQFKKHIRVEHPSYSDEFLKELNPPTELTKKQNKAIKTSLEPLALEVIKEFSN